MKYLIWIIFLPITVVLIVFGVNNRGLVPVDLWPLSLIIEIPLIALLFGVLLAGVVWGGVSAWLRAGSTRRIARQNAREVRTLTFENQRQGKIIESLKADTKTRNKHITHVLTAKDVDDDGTLKLEKTSS